MKTKLTWAAVLIGITSTCVPAGAQEFWYIPHVDDARTPIELQLQSGELAMPGFGIAATKNAIIKRLEFALDNKWLSASQDQQLCNDLKSISDKEQALRSADGNLSYKSRVEVARALTELNNKFEDLVLVREQSSPGVQGLQARQALMIQRVNQAIADGKIAARRGAQLKSDIRAIAVESSDKGLNDEQARQIASQLTSLNNELDKDLRGSVMQATRPIPFTR